LHNERERADAADRDLTVTVEAHTELEAEFRKVEAACRHETQARTALDEQLTEARGLLDLALAESTQARSELDEHTVRLRGQLDERAAESATLSHELI